MLKEAYDRYRAIEALLESDEELSILKQRLLKASMELESILARLAEDEQAVITEYTGLLAEIEQRIVEIACFPA